MLAKIVSTIDALSEVTGKAVSFLMVPNFLALVYEVIARYIFHSPTQWSYEVTYFLYGTCFLITTAFTLKHKRHIRIEVFYNKFPKRVQAIIDCVGYIFLFVPSMLILITGAVDLVQYSYIMNERSTASAWRPILWPFKTVILVSFVLVLLQGVAELIRSIPGAFRGAEK